MGFWENTVIGRYFDTNKKTKVINGSVVNMEIDAFSIGSSGNSYYPDSTDFVKLQERNFVLNNVIGDIAKKFSNAVFTDEKESALLKKINNPNQYQSKEEFLKEFAIYILAAGYTVIWKSFVSFGNFETLQLINLNPDDTEINSKDAKITFSHDGKSITVDLSDVIVFYDTRRNSTDKKGYARVIPLKSQLDNISLAQKAKNIQIQNSGTTIVSPKQTSAGNSIDEGLNAMVPIVSGNLITQKDAMEEKLNTRGLENRIIVSSKGLDAVNLSEKLNNIDFNKIVEPDALVVCDAFGFPEELSPFGQDATFDNKAVAELALFENEIIPLANNLTNSLSAEFKNKGNIQANYNHLGVMSIVKNRVIDTNTKIITQYDLLFSKELITKEEYKAILINNKILDEKR